MMKKLLRWLSVLILPLLATGTVIICAVIATRFSHRGCNPDFLVANLCVESGHTDIMNIIVFASVALITMAFVILPGFIAPRFHRWFAATGYALLAGLALFIQNRTGWPDLTPPLILLLGTGLVSFLIVWFSRRTLNE